MGRLEFDAVVRSAKGGGALVVMPEETAQVFGTRARFPVRAWFNDVEYFGSTMPTGEGLFCLGLTKAIRIAAGIEVGHEIHVVIERDTSERSVEVPDDLADALDAAGLSVAFSAMAFTHRREYVQWVGEAKRPETRQRRVAKVVEMIAGRGSGLPG